MTEPDDLPPAAEDAVLEAANAIVTALERLTAQLPEGVEASAARERLVDYLEAWPELRQWQAAFIALRVFEEEADRL